MKKSKTVQLGLRIDREILEKIEKLAAYENIDKLSWIRRAISTFLKGEEEGAKDQAIEDYIRLRITEETLAEMLGSKKIALDLKEARSEMLKSVKNK